MAELGKISGQMLKSNLERLGVDLVFENQSGDNNLYLDVNALKIGINTDALSRELTINGDSLFDGLIVDNDAQLVNLYIDGDAGTITSYDSNLTILNSGQLYAPALETPNLRFANNYIQGLISNEDIELDANGLGRTILPSDVTIEGNLSGVVDLSIVGDIVFGNDFETDTITFNAEISGNLIPSVSDTYSLGTEESKWGLIRSRLINGEFLVTDDIGLVPDLNPNVALRVGKSIFVGKNGSDTDDGYHQLAPFATLKHALSVAVAGDVITLYPGVYQEEFPLSVPTGVTVKGTDIRQVIIEPTVDTKDKDVFLLNGETTVSDLTVRNFLYNSTNDTGYGFRFDENFEVTTRSPYVQNITVITAPEGSAGGPTDIYVDPLGLAGSYSANSVAVDQINYTQSQVEGWIGKLLMTWNGETVPVTFYEIVDVIDEPLDPGVFWRIVLDRNLETAGEEFFQFSIYPNNGETSIVGTAGYTAATDYSRSFLKAGLPPFFATLVEENWTCQIGESLNIVDYIEEDPANSNWWKVNFKNITAPTAGLPIFTSPNTGSQIPAGRGALVDGSSATSTSKEASMLFHSVTFIVPDSIGLYMTNGVRVEWLNSFTYFASKGLYATNGSTGRLSTDGSTIVYGAELRSIASANVYGLVGAEGDGSSVLMYLINHNFGYIGTGTDATNDPSAVDQDSEVVTVNDARVYWQSDDHNGNFRVGEAFFVDQETGLVTFNSQGQSVGGINQLLFSNGVDLTVLNGNKVQTGNVIFENNQITTTTGDLNLDSFVDFPELADVAVTGNLTTTGNFNVDGQITFGNQTVDTVSFEADVDSNLLPKLSNESTLGSESRKWNSIWLGQASIGDIVINDNQITTLTSNSDLEISAAAGNNVSVTNLLLPNDFSSASAVNFLDTDIVGNVLLSGTSVLNGNTVVEGNFGTSSQLNLATDLLGFGNILFTGNAITTTDSNSDLELRANGTGQVLADSIDVSSDVNYGSINSTTIVVNETLESNSYTVGNFLLKDNFLEVAADIDLIFDPAGTGKTSLQSLASISNNLTVTDLTTLEDVTATGTYQLLGTFNRSGGVFDTLGDYDLTGEISSTTLQLGNISFSNNSISNTSINDLTVSADKIIFNPSLEILNDLVIDNDLTVGNYTAIDLELESLQTDDIQIFDNVITTTVSLSSLTLRAAGTGKVIVDDSLTVSLDTIVTGTSTLSTTDITGTVTLTGDIDQTNAVTNQRTGNTDLTGLLTAAELTVDDITIDNDEILATGDLELSAGVANDIIISSDVNITQNLAVDGSVIADNIVATEIILDSIGTGDILIDSDTVATTASNSNLEIAATTVTFNKDTVANSITVANLLDVQNTLLNGNLTTSGKTAVGDFNLDGTLNIIGDATSDGLVVDDIEISSSTVTTIASNADLELRANGAGDVVFQSSVSITNDLEILGNTTANSIYANTIIYDYFSNGTVRFDDNRISTTISNSDLELQAAGSGSVVVPSNNVQIDNDLKVNGTGGPANDGVYTSTNSGGEVAVQKDIFGNALLLTGEPSSATWQAVKTLEPGDLGIIILSGTSYPFTLTSWIDPSREEAVIDIPTLPNGIASFDLTITLRPRFDGASLNNTSIVGTLTYFGDRNQSGGSYQVDNYELIGSLATDFRSQFGDLSIDGNQISNTVIDSDIILSAAGTGKVLATADLIIGEDLSVGGNISSTELSITSDVTSDRLDLAELTLAGNHIFVTSVDNNLELLPTGNTQLFSDAIINNTLTVTNQTTLKNTDIVGNVDITIENSTYPTIDPADEIFKFNFNQPNLASITDLSTSPKTVSYWTTGGLSLETSGTPTTGNYFRNSGVDGVGIDFDDNSEWSDSIANALFTGNRSWSIEARCQLVLPDLINFRRISLYGQRAQTGFAVAIVWNSFIATPRWEASVSVSNLIGTTGTSIRIPLTGLQENQWQHVVISYSAINSTSGTVRAYVDGQLTASQILNKGTNDFYKTYTSGIVINSPAASNRLDARVEDIRMLSSNPWPVSGFSVPLGEFNADYEDKIVNIDGSLNQTGNLSIDNLTVSQNADLSGVELLGNRIYSNSTLTLTAPVGRAVVFNDNLIVDNSVAVGGDLYSPIINVLDQATVSSLYVDDILVQENFVTTTVSNSDLELRAPAPIIYDNLITNGTFDTSFNGWFSEGLSVLEVVDGVARISGGAEGALYQTVAVQPNTDYTISVDMVLAGNDITFSNLFVIGSTFLVNRSLQNTTGTTVTETFNSGSNTSVIVQFQAVNDDLIEFDNVELVEGVPSTYFPPRAIVIPSNNLEITNNLTVITDTDLQSTIITGSLLHTGDRTQTGTVDQTGDLNITGSITSGDADLGNITISGSTISTTESNSDLELIASGGVGNIVVPNSNVIIENNLTVRTAYVTIPLIFLPENVVTNQYLTQQLRIRDNFIETTESNADLELSTAGTGKVSIGPSLDLTQDLSLTGATNLSDLTVTGSLGVVGNITRTGTTQVNGTVNVDGDLTASLDVNFENIQIVDNRVATSDSNSNLELIASGSNVIFDDRVTLEQDLTVSDTLYSQNLTATNLSVNTVVNDDIQISDNTITTTLSNSNLNLRGNNLGKVRLEKIDISDATITTVDTNQNLIILPYATKILDIDKTTAVKIPSGTTAQKSTGLTGELRFNTTINRFEGWTNNGAITYGGIFSRNRQTSITALDTNILDFKTANTTRMSVAAAGVTLTGLLADSIRINGNTVSSTSNSDINLTPDGIGEVIMGDIRFDSTNTALLNTALADPMIIQNSGAGYVKFNSTNALVIPVGDTASRPSSPELGDIRFNTDLSAPEIFTGIAYSTLAGESSVATLEEIQELNEIYAILLG